MKQMILMLFTFFLFGCNENPQNPNVKTVDASVDDGMFVNDDADEDIIPDIMTDVQPEEVDNDQMDLEDEDSTSEDIPDDSPELDATEQDTDDTDLDDTSTDVVLDEDETGIEEECIEGTDADGDGLDACHDSDDANQCILEEDTILIACGELVDNVPESQHAGPNLLVADDCATLYFVFGPPGAARLWTGPLFVVGSNPVEYYTSFSQITPEDVGNVSEAFFDEIPNPENPEETLFSVAFSFQVVEGIYIYDYGPPYMVAYQFPWAIDISESEIRIKTVKVNGYCFFDRP